MHLVCETLSHLNVKFCVYFALSVYKFECVSELFSFMEKLLYGCKISLTHLNLYTEISKIHTKFHNEVCESFIYCMQYLYNFLSMISRDSNLTPPQHSCPWFGELPPRVAFPWSPTFCKCLVSLIPRERLG
jgi:hypothetical protein